MLRRCLILAACTLSLVACSGGGGGGGGTAATLVAAISSPGAVVANEVVLLDGSASSSAATSFSWRLLDPADGQPFEAGEEPATLLNPIAPVTSFVAPDADLTVRVELQVSDGTETAVTTLDVDITPSLIASPIVLRGRLEAVDGSEGQAEISAFDPVTNRLFVISSAGARIDVFSLSVPSQPVFVGTVEFGSGIDFAEGEDLPATAPNSVSVFRSGNVSRALIALENLAGTDPQQQRGYLAFVDPVTLDVDDFVQVGALPDMVAVNADGFALVANEGEPSDDYQIDPEGSVSIVELDAFGLPTGSVVDADFTAFNALESQLTAAGVRIFGAGDPSVAEDLEPEFVAPIEGTSLALVSLQENNALAIVDAAAGQVTGILPLGTKDWTDTSQPRFATPSVTRFAELPTLGETASEQTLRLGGFSGLTYAGTGMLGQPIFLASVARGPVLPPADVTGDESEELVFALPEYQARWVRLIVNPLTGAPEVLDETLLTRLDGNDQTVPITGLPNLPAISPGLAGNDLAPVDLNGQPLALDAYGANFGAIVTAPDGSVWMADEYRPSLYRFTSSGQLVARYVPEGTSEFGGGADFGQETLPPAFGRRQNEQGFSGLAFDESAGVLYAFLRAPLDNPDTADDQIGASSRTVRVLGVDPETGQQVSQHAFLLDEGGQLGDAVWSGEPGVVWIVEHDGVAGANARVDIARLDLNQGTDLLEFPLPGLLTQVLEAGDPALASSVGFDLVPKQLIADLATRGLRQFERVEGLTRLEDGRLALITDDRSGLAGVNVDLAAGELIEPLAPASESAVVLVELGTLGFDASDADGGPAFDAWPVRGMYQPDALATFFDDGEFYFVTANEGDARDYAGFSEEVRVGDTDDGKGGPEPVYPLDPGLTAEVDLTLGENLGRLKVTTADGDTDGDGDFDVIHAYGARSFSVRDGFGRIVFDSGDDLARWTLQLDPDFYNANKAADATDERSDDKGVEPEGIAIADLGDQRLLFVGCERSNGVIVYDLTNPGAPRFLDLLRQDEDVAPEGLIVVPAEDSPTDESLLIVSYEDSGSVVIYGLGDSAGQ